MEKMRIDADIEELKRINLFQNVNLESIKGLLEACSVRVLEPQEILISPKELNKAVFFILSGRLRVILDSPEAYESIATLEPGESVGEISLMDKQLTASYVVADEDCRVLVMDEDILWSLVRASHAAACNLLFILAMRLRNTDSVIVEGIKLQQNFNITAALMPSRDYITSIGSATYSDGSLYVFQNNKPFFHHNRPILITSKG
jgi:CRP-like cAMP-binding protein